MFVFISLFGVKNLMGQEVWSLTPRVSITERYVSNPAFAEKGSEGEADYITVISPGLSLNITKPTLSVTGSYGLDINRYARRHELDKITHLANITISKSYSQKTDYSLSDRFAFTPDSVMAGETGVLVERTDIYSNNISLSVNHILNPVWSLRFLISDNATDFDDPALVDSRRDSLSTGITYKFTPKVSITTAYTLNRFSLNRDERVVVTHELTTGVNYAISSSLSLSASGGVSYNAETEDFDFVTAGDMNIGFTRKTPTASMSLTYNRGISTTTGLSEETSTSQSIRLSLNKTLTRALSFSLNGDVTDTKSDISSDVDIISYNVSASGTYIVNTWLALSLGYAHYRQWSDGTKGKDIERDTGFFRIDLHPRGWNL